MTHTPETRKRALEKVRARRVKWLEENGPCVKCGSDENLEVDHIDPSEKTSHRIWSWSDERREAELKKCQVLCRECHEKKTGFENSFRSQGVRHGTGTAYRRYGCRCEICMEHRRKVKRSDYAKSKMRNRDA